MLYGLVLAGGKSQRMGSDKSGLVYYRVPQRLHLYSLLGVVCDKVFISCRKEQAEEWQDGLPYIFDGLEGKGVLSGIFRAFEYQSEVAWLVLACDLPFIDEFILNFLIEKRQKNKFATAFINEDKRLEPLCSIWENRSYDVLKKAIEINELSPKKLLEAQDTNLVVCPDDSYLTNANHYEDYLEARKHIL